MTVRIFVSRDSEGRQWAPDYAHEAAAAQEIIKKLWGAFHHRQTLYAVIANLHDPNADMVIMTERGLGIVELKHYFGEISIGSDGTWYADSKRIRSGVYSNPHQQAQAYAETVRKKTLQIILPKWMRRDSRQWGKFKFQITVCFTNPNAQVDRVKRSLPQDGTWRRKPWESSFTVTTPEEIPEWAANLRFEVDLGRSHRFEPYRLDRNTILNVATLRFDATEWSEILDLMPTGEPYGYLLLMERDKQGQTFNLHKDEIVMGRDPDKCDVVIPRRFSRVSRVHARITRRVDGVVLEDLSKHGTFVNDKVATGLHPLSHDQTIILGGAIAGEKVCSLRFLLRAHASIEPRSTEVADDT